MADDKIKIDVEVDVKGKGDVDGLKDSFESITDAGGKLPGVLGDVASGVGGLTSGFGSMTKAALAFIATPIGLILAGIAVAIVSVKEAFTGSEEGQNKFAKAMGVIGAITEKVMDIFEDIGNVIISAFENPKQAIKDFTNLVKENIINRFTGLLELIPQLGKAIGKLFEGDFVGAGKTATDAVAKVTLGVEDFSNKIIAAKDALVEFGKEAAIIADKAAKVADIRAKADKEEREFSTKRLELEAKIAAIKEDIADKEGISAEKRKALIKEAQALNEQLFSRQKELAQQRATAAALELEYSDKTKENLQAVVDANNAVIEVDIKRAQSGKTLQKALTAINNEIASDAKKVADEKKKADELVIKEAEDKLKQEAQEKRDALDKFNKYRIDALKGADAEEARISAEAIERNIANGVILTGEADALSAYKKKLLDKETADEKQAQEERRAIQDQALGAAQGLSDLVFSIKSANLKKGSAEELENAKKQFKINKALQLTGAIVAGARAITTSLASSPVAIGPVPNPAGIASLAFAVITTAASIAKIAATQFTGGESTGSAGGVPSAGGGGGGGSTDVSKNFEAPNLNLFNSQKNGGNNGKPEPLRAYVVSENITDAQHRDELIKRRATY